MAQATDPTETLARELDYDVTLYERLRTEGLAAVPSFGATERDKALIALRIARGWSQRQLAEALGVSETLVSRDERNDYHGITQERFARVLQVLGVEEVSRYQGGKGGLADEVSESVPSMPLWRALASDERPRYYCW